MSGVITTILQEGFGNRMAQYAFVRGYAETHGCTLQTNPWMGQKVFMLDDPPIENPKLVERGEDTIDDWKGEVNIRISGGGLHQHSLYYTRAQARKWFTFRPEIAELLKAVPHFEVAAHLRWADFVGLENFVTISSKSYYDACEKFGIDRKKMRFICEEDPIIVPGLPVTGNEHSRGGDPGLDKGLSFLADFYALMQADILFRANSTFSLMAALIGHNKRVFCPDLFSIPYKGPRPLYQLVPFVEGNHLPITHYWGHSELHWKEE